MSGSAYDWFLKIEMARAGSAAVRQRRRQDEEDFMRRAGQAMGAQNGLGQAGKTEGRGLATETKGSLLGLSKAPRRGSSSQRPVIEERQGGSGAKLAQNVLPSVAALPSPAKPKPLFAPSVAGNAKLAAGHQPVVIKVVSYAGGAGRAGATAKYIQRDEVVLETHDSELLSNHDAVENEIAHWSEHFETRKPSQDVVTLGFVLPGESDSEEAREALAEALSVMFEGHKFASRFEQGKAGAPLRVTAVVVMSGEGERFKIAEQGGIRRLAADTRKVFAARLEEAGLSHVQLETISKPGHGREGASFQLRKHVAGGPLTVGEGEVKSVQDAKDVARHWTRTLHSHGPRDTMHLVLSAKIQSGEEPEAFKKAVREFLHDTFADHKFMFGLHTDKVGRIHAHAVIAVRGETGEKLRPSRLGFLSWREAFAQKAQEQGLKMVATVARQQASSQSYGKFDKAIVNAEDHPREGREKADIAYNRRFPHVAAAARHRMSVARVNPPSWAVTEKQRVVIGASLASWEQIIKSQPANLFAQEQAERLKTSLNGGVFLGQLLQFAQKGEPTMTAIQMAASLARMNEIVDKTSAELSPETRAAFRERTSKVLTDFGTRIDLKRLAENGVQTVGGEDLQRIAQYGGDKLIQRAREIEATEKREAVEARQDATKAVDKERRDRSTNPTSIEQAQLDRRVTEDALANSNKQAREAQAASAATQDLGVNPGAAIDPQALQTSPHLQDLEAQRARTVAALKAEAEKEGPEKAKSTRQH